MSTLDALALANIHLLWQGTLIAALLALSLRIFRSASARYLMACVALLTLPVAFGLTFAHLLPANKAMGGEMLGPLIIDFGPVAGSSDLHSVLDFEPLARWLTIFWIAGVCCFYLHHIAGWLYSLRIRRPVCHLPQRWQQKVNELANQLKLSRGVRLLESCFSQTPGVMGHFRPLILVPIGFLASLPPDQVEVILLHELAHIRRSDYLVNICQRLIEGLLFYHPAVWWISHVIRTERENACDDMVLKITGDAHHYAEALTALEKNRITQEWPAVAATGGNLMKRIQRLLYPPGPANIGAPVLALLFLLLSIATVMTAFQQTSFQQTSFQQTSKTDTPYQRWLNEEVVYIIEPEEKATFEHLKTDKERQHFIASFWARRDPKFKEEHYRRVAYANSHWTGTAPGWKTDRGRIYIRFGPPDEIDSHPSGGSYRRPESEGGATVTTYPFEDWRYSHFEGLGSLDIEFVDLDATGDFRVSLDPNKKVKKP